MIEDLNLYEITFIGFVVMNLRLFHVVS